MGNLRLVDNGVVHRRSPALADLPQVRAYHLVPAGAAKARAVAAHMQARQYAPDECFAVGDSREDLGVAEHVGAFWLVGNAVERDPTIVEAMEDAQRPRGGGALRRGRLRGGRHDARRGARRLAGRQRRAAPAEQTRQPRPHPPPEAAAPARRRRHRRPAPA